MKSGAWIMGRIMIVMVASMCAWQVRADLIVNGSFELGDFIGDPDTAFNSLPAGSTAITGWTATHAGVDWHQAHFGPAFDGIRMVDLTFASELGGISQQLHTNVGQQYVLSFALAGPGLDFQDPRQVVVNVAGLSEIFNTPASNAFPLTWQTHSLSFVAIAGITTLEFVGNSAGAYWGPVIDNVSVVPAPPSAAVAAGGAGGVLLRRRRR